MPLRQIDSELKELDLSSVIGLKVGPRKDDLFKQEGMITGPKNTPQEGGTFILEIIFPQDYPLRAAKIHFKTKIYHECLCWLEKPNKGCISHQLEKFS